MCYYSRKESLNKFYIKNGDVESIKTFLMNLGFEPNIITVFDEAEIDTYLDIKYDLIISDFNLNQENGDVIIYKLRKEKRLDTEILFYSAKTNFVQDAAVKERLAFMERINIQVGRERLLDKIEDVIRLTIKKLFDLNATRGLITAATSHLDVEIEESYYLLIDKLVNDDTKPKIEKIFRTDYKEIKKNLLKKCKALRDSHTADYRTYFAQSDAFRKWDLLKELISLNVPDGFNLELFKKYSKEVIDIRNKFAHAKAVEVEGTPVLKGHVEGENFEFTEESCIKIRQNLIKHKQNIEVLKSIVQYNIDKS